MVKLKSGADLLYLISYLTDVLTVTNFFTLPRTFSWSELLTLNMFSKVPQGEIKKVINFALRFDIH